MTDRLFLKAGNAIFTLEPSKADADRLGLAAHYTFRINKPKPKPGESPKPYFASVLVGPENTRDYAYLGVFNATRGTLHLSGASKFPKDSWQVRLFNRAVSCVWENRVREIEAAGWCLRHSGYCCRCGKVLTVPASLETGIGPECEVLVMAGFVHIDDVPQVEYPLVARMQAAYWMQGLKDTLDPIKDACLDSGLDQGRAEQVASATQYTMRKFKKGKNWPNSFKRVLAMAA